MTEEEIITVVTAHKEGKTIEYCRKTDEKGTWNNCPSFIPWNFEVFNYRIKPEPRYRPFKNAEEVMEAIKEHGDWVKHDNDIERVFSFNHKTVNLTYSNVLYSDAFKMYSFYDGTPFGKLEE